MEISSYLFIKEEVRKALKRVKNGTAVGPDDTRYGSILREVFVEFLTRLFNGIVEDATMPRGNGGNVYWCPFVRAELWKL